MSYSNFDLLSLLNSHEENLENSLLNNYPLDESFSLIFSKDSLLKNPPEVSDVQSLTNSNNKNIEGDSPAPAPLRASPTLTQNQNQNQSELSNSHNMECPEVVNEPIGPGEMDKNSFEMIRSLDLNNNGGNDEFELIEKPFDKTRFFLESDFLTQSMNNLDSSTNNNCDLENKSAPVNVVCVTDSVNPLANRSTNTDMQELSCPKNNSTSVATPLCSKNRKNKEKILFINTDTSGNRIKNKNGLVRKLKPDSLRKKIKSRFHKKLREIINKELKQCGSILLFDLFPQSFITNINIEFNRPLLNLTMRELFQKIFGFKAKDKEKINYNTKVLKYIEDNLHLNNKHILF